MALWFQRGTLPDDADVRDSSRLQCVLHIERDDPGRGERSRPCRWRDVWHAARPPDRNPAWTNDAISASSISASFISGSARQQQ